MTGILPRRDDLVVTRWRARFQGRWLPCAIGRGGVTSDKREGDGATPLGVMHIVGVMFRGDRAARIIAGRSGAFRQTEIGPGDIWSDDPSDPAYNHGFHAPAHPFSHEKLRRADPLYDLVAITDHNWPDAVPGQGSAIFVHRWRKPRHPTEGCVAFAPSDLRWVLSRWRPWSRIIVR